jgi:hypothetical protein
MMLEARLKAIEKFVGKFRSKALSALVPSLSRFMCEDAPDLIAEVRSLREQLQKERAFRREFLTMLVKDVSVCELIESGSLFDKEIPALTLRLREVAVLRAKLYAAAMFLRTNVASRMDEAVPEGEITREICDPDFEADTDEKILTAKLALETLLLSANIAKVSHALLQSTKIPETKTAEEAQEDGMFSALERNDRYAEISVEKWLMYGDIEAEVRCLSKILNNKYEKYVMQ